MNSASWEWILQFLGRLHPLAVHFPIGLLVVALFLEFLCIGGKRKGLRDGINAIVYLGGVFAIISALLGWSLSSAEDYQGDLVQLHQNMGIATAIGAVITAILLRNTIKEKLSNFILYRLFLIATVVLLTVAGHLGSELTHGEDFLSSVLPGNKEVYDNEKTEQFLAQFAQLDSLSEEQQDDLNMEVRAIFAHNCYQCHNENKQKGELVLDSKRGVYKGGESGSVIVAGAPNKSELYKRITLPPDHDDVMPKKGKTLKENEIALIELWIKNGAHWSDRALKVFPEAELALSKPTLPVVESEQHPIDKFAHSYFEKNNMSWQKVVDDRTFIRRVYLDIVGLLPEPEKITAFRNDNDSKKREKLIDELLNDNQNYTQHWISFWNDLLRNDYSGPGFITGGRKQITDWLYKSLMTNKPYDEMVKELINPTKDSEGFIKGIQWRGVVNASQRTEMQAAQNIGQSLMGVNVKCASCHNSFVSNLTLEQSYGFATIFSDSLLQLNRCDMPIDKMAKPNFLYPELGSVEAETVQERLMLLSKVIVKRDNGRLYRTLVNRIWKRLLGRGFIEPIDEMDNTPWNSELLDWLSADFIDSDHNIKHLMKQIMTSKTYQLSTVNYKKIEETKSNYVFNGPLLRRLSAEQFSDAVSQTVAPIYYATAYDPSNEGLSASRIWHKESKFDRIVLPEPGKRFFRHTFSLPKKEVEKADFLISVDHSYTLYLNEKEVSKGKDWRKVDKQQVAELLIQGDNIIALEGSNEGKIANPAGVLFAMKISFTDGEEKIITSNQNWKSTAKFPNAGWTSLDFDDKDWKNAQNYGSNNWGKLVNFSFLEKDQKFARASLVKQHPFMKALGRPTRENVSTSRDDQATLLQALELTNGEFFNSVLAEGAELWLQEYNGNTSEILESFYMKTLGRKPTKKEAKVMVAALGKNPSKEALQDVFWATLISPEFQFIN